MTHTSAGDSWTLGQVWVSLLLAHCSFLLGPGVHQVLFVPSKSLLPQSCVNSGSPVVGLRATSSMKAYAVPMSMAPRAPTSAVVHCWPICPQEALKHHSVSALGSLKPGSHKAHLSPLRVTGGYGVCFYTHTHTHTHTHGFPDSSVGKGSACSAGDCSSIPGLGKSTREGIWYPTSIFGFSL